MTLHTLPDGKVRIMTDDGQVLSKPMDPDDAKAVLTGLRKQATKLARERQSRVRSRGTTSPNG